MTPNLLINDLGFLKLSPAQSPYEDYQSTGTIWLYANKIESVSTKIEKGVEATWVELTSGAGHYVTETPEDVFELMRELGL